MALDLTKPVQTRDGRPVRYLGTLEGRIRPLIFAVPMKGKGEFGVTRYPDGQVRRYSKGDGDIINTPERTSRFHTAKGSPAYGVNGVPRLGGGAFLELADAQSCVSDCTPWDGVVEFVYGDNVIVDTIFHEKGA